MSVDTRQGFVGSGTYAAVRDAAQEGAGYEYAQGADIGLLVGMRNPDVDPITALHESEAWKDLEEELKRDPIFCLGALWGAVTGGAQAKGEIGVRSHE